MRIALVQSDTVWHDPDANLAKAARFVEEAAKGGARVVVFPELFTTGFTMEPERFAQSVPGPTSNTLAALATTHGVWIIGTEIGANASQPHNIVFALSPTGELAAVYRKIHPFSYGDENKHYTGGTELALFEIDGVKTGLQICYDLRFPETFRALSRAGAELVFVPANWPARRVMHWRTLLAARAIENQMVVCGVNRAGRDPKLEYPGQSVVHDAKGELLAEGGAAEQLVFADVDVEATRAWRREFPALRDRRPDVYAHFP